MFEKSRLLAFSGRLYSLLLLAYPTRFRRAYGREMAQVFRDDIRSTFQENGAAGLIGLWFLVMFDLLKTAFAEHIWEVFHMPVEKLDRWTGLAAALGGALIVFVMFFIDQLQDAEFVLLSVVVIGMFLLWAIALAGLYRRLPAASHPGNKVTFAIAELSLLLSMIGLLIMPLAELGGTMIFIGYFGLGLGIAGMGIIALRYRALGGWSFTPLLVAVAWLVFLATMISVGFSVVGPLPTASVMLIGVSWLLLGIGLWSSARDMLDPALPA
jgi:hypothetical protein